MVKFHGILVTGASITSDGCLLMYCYTFKRVDRAAVSASSNQQPMTDNRNNTGQIKRPANDAADEIAWFRQASPYIKAYRNSTLVLHIDGSLLDSPHCSVMAQDIALLSHLGLRLVLVPGLRQRINRQLEAENLSATAINANRLTDSATLDVVRRVAGEVRIEIESLLSLGLINTPMAGAHLSVVSGNFVTAQPVGIRDGVDFGYAGDVRKIHRHALDTHTAAGHIVLLPPLGYSRTGELFNLQSENLAATTAHALNADKLVYLSQQSLCDEDNNVIAEAAPDDIRQLLKSTGSSDVARLALLDAVLNAADSTVGRVHVLDSGNPDALLKELFTRDGSGTLISTTEFDTIRAATIDDVGGIIELIGPLERDGTLIPRSREQLELAISDYFVCEREGMVTACAALSDADAPSIHNDQSLKSAEIACVVTHPAYREGGRAEQLLGYLLKVAQQREIELVYVLTTRTNHWFIERGFIDVEPDVLPQNRRYDIQRNSRVLVRTVPSFQSDRKVTAFTAQQ